MPKKSVPKATFFNKKLEIYIYIYTEDDEDKSHSQNGKYTESRNDKKRKE